MQKPKMVSLKDYTTLKIGGKCLVYEPKSCKELEQIICRLEGENRRYKVIGNGSNILVGTHLKDLVVVTTRSIKERPVIHQTTVKVSAGQNINSLILLLAKSGLSGLERLYGIPATVGGMVVNNASAFGTQICSIIESVQVLDGKKVKILDKSQIEFSHHSSSLQGSGLTLLSVEFSLKRLAPSTIYGIIKETIEKRKAKQPKGNSAGSMFKAAPDGRPAGLLIDMAGLKGLCEGGAKISEKHANFFLNQQNATFYDMRRLIKKAKEGVKQKFGVDLELEVEIIGE